MQRGGFDGVDDAAHEGREHGELAPPSQLSHGDRLMTNREPTELAAIHLDPSILQGFRDRLGQLFGIHSAAGA